MTIPVFVPKLPSVERLVPYLREIELSRNYSNFGPMVLRLHSELAKYFGVQVEQVITLANATLALEGAIQTTSTEETMWLSPSWTYAATNLALERCRVSYRFGDIDKDWRLIPDNSYNAIMDVCPFGDTLEIGRFNKPNQTILVDAAASFPALKDCGKILSTIDGPVGIVVSFHPTKVVPGIEGGVFISNRFEWVKQVKQWSRFGMTYGSRISEKIGTNAKMNEYQAAMILASMEDFEVLSEHWRKLLRLASQSASSLGLSTQPAMKREAISSYWIVESNYENINLMEANLKREGIGTMRWWQHGCHNMPLFRGVDYLQLPETDRVANSTIGLPFHLDMKEQDFDTISDIIANSM